MTVAVTAVSTWTSSGTTRELREALALGRADPSPAPYPLDGLPGTLCGAVPGLDRDRPAEALLARVVGEVVGASDLSRTGLVVATSSGNRSGPWERWNRARLGGEAVPETGPGRDEPTHHVARRFAFGGPVTTLSIACASGAAALGVGAGWLVDGRCDRVVCAGVDALSLFVHAGFSGLGAVASGLPRAFRADRDGLMLGEGAAALLLERSPATRPLAWLRAVRGAADAHHFTTPHPQGRGAEAAIRAALSAAGFGPEEVDAVSVHGTATPANDTAEAAALCAVFGPHPPPLYAVKQITGHTMGAAGAVEAAVAVSSLADGAFPRSLGRDDAGHQHLLAMPTPLAPTARRAPPRVLLAMSSAFGGINVATVWADSPGTASTVDTPVVELARFDGVTDPSPGAWPDAPDHYLRAPTYVRAGLLAIRALGHALPAGTALVLASRSNCVDADRTHHDRILLEGATRASRRAFVQTIVAAPLGEASLVWGVHGPLLAFVDGPERAWEEARRLVRQGVVASAVALSIETPLDGGPPVVASRSYGPRP